MVKKLSSPIWRHSVSYSLSSGGRKKYSINCALAIQREDINSSFRVDNYDAFQVNEINIKTLEKAQERLKEVVKTIAKLANVPSPL